MTVTLPAPAPLLGRVWDDAPGFAALTVMMALAMLPLLAAHLLDPRQFGGEGVWVKPLKFHLALVLFVGTLAVYARWLPAGLTETPGWRLFAAAVIGSAVAELAWIGGAAAMGVASHFNTAPVWAAIYPLMGIVATLLTSAALVMGVAIARNGATGLPPALHLALWLGLVLTFVLTMAVVTRLAGGTGHHIGVPVSGVRVPLMGWSREVGDLRVAHFFATHALHALPLAGLVAVRLLPDPAARLAVIGAALAYAGLVVATFLQALAGRPFL